MGSAAKKIQLRSAANAAAPNHDVLVALQNAFKLGGSLLFTWGIALAVRMLLPRYIGPAAFGYINFADAFTVAVFVLLSFGIDTHIRVEVPLRRELASEIFGGVLLLRLSVAVALFGAIAFIMRLTHRPPTVTLLVFLFGFGQVCAGSGLSLAAVLHARGRVDGLSIVNGVSKVLWAGGILIGVAVGRPLMGVPLSFFFSELVKALSLFVLAYRHAGLRLRVNTSALRTTLRKSLPYYVNNVATTMYGRIDVALLSFLISDVNEVGWYGAATTLAGLCLLVTPLIGWVLVPLFAKAAARGRDELRRTVARSVEIVLLVAIPTSLMTALGAEFWVGIIFGPAFAPAAAPLRILAIMFVLTYVAAVSATSLNVQGRGWLVTVVSVSGLLLCAVLNVAFVRIARAYFPGPGAVGAAAAAAVMTSEIAVTVAMTVLLDAMSFDRRSVTVLARTLAVVGLVLVIDHVARPLGPIVRLPMDLASYVALALLLRAVRWREVASFTASSLRHRATTEGAV
jgi:O-antigen/teichoic acid export membrane protein